MRPVRLIVILACLLIGVRPAAARPQYAQVRVLAQWDSPEEEQDFKQLVLPFFQQYNVEVNLVSARDLEQTLQQEVEAGTPPDIVLMSDPGLMRHYAGDGYLVDLGAALDDPAPGYPLLLTEGLTVDDTIYGRYIRLNVKGVMWLDPLPVIRMGYTIPVGWDELIATSTAMTRGGTPAWALGLDTGEMGTDIIETILYQRSDLDTLDGLADGSISWTDPQVRDAWEAFGALLDTGTAGDPLQLSPVEAMQLLFHSPARSYFGLAPSNARRWIASDPGLVPGQDIMAVLLPANGTSSRDVNGSRVIIGGDFITLFNSDPVTLQFAQYLASFDTAAAWAALGSAIAPYPGVTYPDPVMTELDSYVHRGVPALDVSDRLSPKVRDAFYEGVRQYAADRSTLDVVLENIEKTANK
jgi:alpha-glucoside transport system substrate-binding protein